jgi:uncharacterized membrane protein YeaQ/YmgE (transglycosylase-associated protein family)
MRYPSFDLDGFDALRSNPIHWLFRQFIVYLIAAAFTTTVVVVTAAVYAYLVAPANSPQFIPIVGSVLVGLVAGIVANLVVRGSRLEIWMDVALGIVGAMVGAYLSSKIGPTDLTGFNHYSIFIAVVGAVILLGAYHGLAGRR